MIHQSDFPPFYPSTLSFSSCPISFFHIFSTISITFQIPILFFSGMFLSCLLRYLTFPPPQHPAQVCYHQGANISSWSRAPRRWPGASRSRAPTWKVTSMEWWRGGMIHGRSLQVICGYHPHRYFICWWSSNIWDDVGWCVWRLWWWSILIYYLILGQKGVP